MGGYDRMTTITPRTVFTPDDLLRLPDAVSYELVDGKLVERNMGMESSQIAARILILLGRFLTDHQLGLIFGADASYQCFPDAPNKVRKPDVSFIRSGRLADDRAPQGHSRIHPDLVVEVVSPGDLSYEVEEKVAEYLRAGVPLIWVVHPPTRTVRVHRPRTAPQDRVSDLTDADTLTGEDVLPGFSCAVRDFFG
jgi:Uma2 family endonuclease